MSKQSTLLFVIQGNERLYYYHGLCIWTGSSRTHFIYEVLEDLQPPFCSLLKDFSLPHQAFSEPNTHICTTLTSDPNLSWIYKHTHTHTQQKCLTCSHSASQRRALRTLCWFHLWLGPPRAGSPPAPSSAVSAAVSTEPPGSEERDKWYNTMI